MPGNNVGRGIIVDLREFGGPLAVSSGGVANVGAAVTWGAMDRVAEPMGLRLASNPSSGAVCTMGGMVATNAAGPRIGVGNIRRWVRGVEIVTADGEVGWLGRHGIRQRAFDPDGTLNPGVIVPSPGSRAVADLKVGSRAEPIPEGIETRLREIERTAAWDRPKDAMAG